MNQLFAFVANLLICARRFYFIIASCIELQCIYHQMIIVLQRPAPSRHRRLPLGKAVPVPCGCFNIVVIWLRDY